MNDYTNLLVYYGLKHVLGKWKSYKMSEVYKKWMRDEKPSRICYLCGKHIPYQELSIDHLIPQTVCFQLDMPGLVFDTRNMRLTHKVCNAKKRNEIKYLPRNVVKKLREMGYEP